MTDDTLIGKYSTLKVVKETGFGLYLDGGKEGEILIPGRGMYPKAVPSEIR